MARTGRAGDEAVAVAVVHLPPPLHGLSRVSEVVVAELRGRGRGRVAVADIGGHGRGGAAGGLARLPKVLRAAGTIVRHRRSRRLYLACDSGEGVLFTSLLLRLAGRLGYATHLHHHSLAPVRPPHDRFTAALAGAARKHRARTVHVGACEAMVGEIAAAYGPGTLVRVLPLHDMSEATEPRTPPQRAESAIVVGHLCNLSPSKGLGRVFDLLDAGTRAGLDLHLVLAGPAWDPAARELLERRLAAAGGRATWVGPVTGEAKREFFERIDVFAFPSLYEHESFAIVVAEAQAAGKPVLAYRAGCLDEVEFGAGVVTYPVEVDFVASAVEQLRTWADDRERLAAAGSAAAEQASTNRARARDGLEDLVDAVLAGPTPVPCTPGGPGSARGTTTRLDAATED